MRGDESLINLQPQLALLFINNENWLLGGNDMQIVKLESFYIKEQDIY